MQNPVYPTEAADLVRNDPAEHAVFVGDLISPGFAGYRPTPFGYQDVPTELLQGE